MAFIHVRGKRMLTMSEVARKLYPQWPRTTLASRMKQMNIRKHLCTAREMQKVYSLNGIQKQGINCRLVSVEDLDVFRSVYGVNIRAKQLDSAVVVKDAVKHKQNVNKRKLVKQGKRLGYVPTKRNARRSPTALKDSGIANKQNANRNSTRGWVEVPRTGRASCSKTHVATGINKAASKQHHAVVVNTVRMNKINGQLTKASVDGRKRKYCFSNKKASKMGKDAHPMKKRRKHNSVGSSSESDSTSFDSGISSLTSAPNRNGTRYNKNSKSAITKSENKTKLKYRKHKAALSELKRKNRKTKNGQRKKEVGVKHSKVVMQRNNRKRSNTTITKECVMNLRLSHMNDKDLINSFSKTLVPENIERDKTESYCVKLMPVKPVLKVDTSFSFISNFLFPPSLVVENGELKPACSMVCEPGLRPPVTHPIWKWKVGEPVISNKTQISYKMKKIKCVDNKK